MIHPFTEALVPAAAVSLVASWVPGGKYALYPFKLFTTWVHECAHAVAAILMGGRVTDIRLTPDTAGLTRFQLSRGRFRQGFVASAGYLGSSLTGCAMLLALASPSVAPRWLSLGLGALMLLSLLFWVRGLFGTVAVLSMSAGLLWLGARELRAGTHFLLPFLALQTGLHSLYDLRALGGFEPSVRSDARTMQSLFWLPAPAWAVAWMALSLAFMAGTGWWVLRSHNDAPLAQAAHAISRSFPPYQPKPAAGNHRVPAGRVD